MVSCSEEINRLEQRIEDLERHDRKLSEDRGDIQRTVSNLRGRLEKLRLEEAVTTGTYVWVVCPDCSGTGEHWVGGADVLSDPPVDEGCTTCGATGCFSARVFEGRRKYTQDEMQFHDIPSPRKHQMSKPPF